jgi:class 3 adenylate cyclase/plastocyanin
VATKLNLLIALGALTGVGGAGAPSMPGPSHAGTGAIEGLVTLQAPPRPRRSAQRYPGGQAETHAVQTLPAVVYLVGPVPGASSSAGAPPTMMQRDTTFVPSVVAVRVGGTVGFPNGDPFFHNVFSYSSAKRFDLGRYPQGETKEVTFPDPGIVEVFCEVHEFMRGAILVTENPFYAAVGADGSFRIPDVPAGSYTIAFWHPDHHPLEQEVVLGLGGARAVNWLRESFAAKLLAALFGTVGLLLLLMFMVVSGETSRQVDAVANRTIQNAGTLFDELNDLQRRQAAQLSGRFIDGRRALALLDATIQAADYDYLAEQADYEMQLAGLTDGLLVFTDADGVPVLSMIEGQRITLGDPAGVAPVAERLLQGDQREATAYRLVRGRMYNLTSLYIDLAMRPIGTITFGLPTEEADLDRIGGIGGFEACFHAEGSCVVSTGGVGPELAALMDTTAATGRELRTRAGGVDWSIRAEPLTPGDPAQGERIVAVPLDVVVAPFARIRRALLSGGLGALALAALLGAALSRSLTQPVRALVAATGRVAQGAYDTEVAVTSRDEMGTLADAFNDMTRGLLLRERYRSVLNKVVSQDVAAELMKGDVELGGENRLVSVLFADIRGFTAMTEGMEPQEVIGLLNECMEHLSLAIDVEGGVVDKFIGDEVMAVFGAPVTQDDHARRAVSAALRMREDMAAFNAVRRVRGRHAIEIGVGINSGLAVAGNMGSSNRLNYTVLGDIVNLASRLAGQAQPGEILIGGATLRLVGDSLVAPPLGGRSLKGFSSEVEVYAVESLEASGATLA